MRIVQKNCQQQSHSIGTHRTEYRKTYRPPKHREKHTFNTPGKNCQIIVCSHKSVISQMVHIIIRERQNNRIQNWQTSHQQYGNQCGCQIGICHTILFLLHIFTTFLNSSIQQLLPVAPPYFSPLPLESAHLTTWNGYY